MRNSIAVSGRYIFGFALLAIAAFAGGYVAQHPLAIAHAQSITQIRGTEFILTDAQGRTVGRLRTGRSGSAELMLSNPNDKAQIQMGADSGIAIRDKNGRITWSSPNSGIVPASE